MRAQGPFDFTQGKLTSGRLTATLSNSAASKKLIPPVASNGAKRSGKLPPSHEASTFA